MREQYEAEQKRVENDFNKKYEEFLDGQASFPKTILQKRQSELQEMLDRNIEFKKQSQKMLSEAEANMMEVIKTTIINPALGEDITEAVKQLLNEETKNE